jgi:hypothetical protein
MRWSLNSKLIDTIKRKMINLKIKKGFYGIEKAFIRSLETKAFMFF